MVDLCAAVRDVLADLHPQHLWPRRIEVDGARIAVGDATIRLAGVAGVTVLGLGKAAVAQVRTVRHLLGAALGDALAMPRGFAVTKRDHGDADDGCEVVESAHPFPDATSRSAASELIWRARTTPPDHLLVVCLSGGGSALALSPRPPFSLHEKLQANAELLAAGASIAETNLVRREMSAIKNGGLLAASGARRVLTLVTSDVPVDDLGIVASGPTVHRRLEPQDVRDVARARLSPVLVRRIEAQLAGRQRRQWNAFLLAAAAEHASWVACLGDYPMLAEVAVRRLRAAGVDHVRALPRPSDDAIEDGLVDHLRELEALADRAGSWALVTGGELPVRVHGEGRGGRNTEFVLRLAKALWIDHLGEIPTAVRDALTVVAVGTDGSDGPTDAAGGWLDRATFDAARARGLSLEAALADNDSLSYLEATGTAIRTGPTHTNLMDLRIVARLTAATASSSR